MDGYYHESNGLYFKRLENGDVHLVKKASANPEAETLFEQTILGNIWASVVCFVSAGGEHNGRYLVADKFHNGVE